MVAVRAGDLRHRVTLQSPVASQDGYGAETVTWTDVATVWAAVWPVRGREYFEARQTAAEVTHKVRIRYSTDVSGVTPKWRVVFGSRRFDIEAVINPDERSKYLDLMCVEVIV